MPVCPPGQHNDSLSGACAINGTSDTIAIINNIKNDPDFKIIANALNTYYNSIVSKKINMKTYDLTNNPLFLQTTSSTQSQLNTLVQNIKAAGQRLILRYNFKASQCITCNTSFTIHNAVFDTVITNFQNYPSTYSSFISQSLGLETSSNLMRPNTTPLCCGMWFYACCALAAETIEVFPLYLAACGYCFYTEFCKP